MWTLRILAAGLVRVNLVQVDSVKLPRLVLIDAGADGYDKDMTTLGHAERFVNYLITNPGKNELAQHIDWQPRKRLRNPKVVVIDVPVAR